MQSQFEKDITMFGQPTCPRCQHAIAPARQMDTPMVCDGCGFIASKNEQAVKSSFERRALVMVFGAALLIVVAFCQITSWGGYALEVLPIQAMNVLGQDSLSQAERMAQICLELKKFDCVEREYSRLTQEPTGWQRLGNFRYRRGEYAAASEAYGQFFAAGGQDIDAAYTYARALAQVGRIDDAAKYFDYVLALKPEVLQVTVTQNYVHLLIDNSRLEQAMQLIKSVRHRGETVATFMDSEYKEIRQKMGHRQG